MAQFLITAGPTREYLDDVRYLSNASSGRMGYALARAAEKEGHPVHLVTGPLELPPPKGARVTSVVSALEMERAVRTAAREADIVIMAAAVADFRPAFRVEGKIKRPGRGGRGGRMTLELVENPDILAGLGRRRSRKGQLLVGFALEKERILEHGREKLLAKKADLLAVNRVEVIGKDRTRLWILDRWGREEEWPELTKAAAARRLVRLCLERWEEGGS